VNNIKQITPSTRVIFPSMAKAPKINVKSSSNNPSLYHISFLMFNTVTIAVIPMIKPILAILLPIIVPKTNPELLNNEATIEELSSGNDVPIATNVTPIVKSEILKYFASFAA